MSLQGNLRMVSGQVVCPAHVSVEAMLSQQKQKHLSAIDWSRMVLWQAGFQAAVCHCLSCDGSEGSLLVFLFFLEDFSPKLIKKLIDSARTCLELMNMSAL